MVQILGSGRVATLCLFDGVCSTVSCDWSLDWSLDCVWWVGDKPSAY